MDKVYIAKRWSVKSHKEKNIYIYNIPFESL